MLTVILKDGREKKLNLKSFDREIALRDLWMKESAENPERKIKVTPDEGDPFILCLGETAGMNFSDTLYVRGVVHASKQSESSREQVNDPVGDLQSAIERRKKKNIETLFSMMRSRGVEPDIHNPLIQKIAEAAGKDASPMKMAMYANMACATQKQSR